MPDVIPGSRAANAIALGSGCRIKSGMTMEGKDAR
jgi:hypothetical protein